MDEELDPGSEQLVGRTDALFRAFLVAVGEVTELERRTGVFFRLGEVLDARPSER
jgi:hypothetical protein